MRHRRKVRLWLAAALIGACADEPDVFAWLRAGGGFVDPRQHFAVGENGVRGLFARAPIARGEHPELHVLSDRSATAEYMHA